MPDLLTHHPSLRGGETRFEWPAETLALNIATPCGGAVDQWPPASVAVLDLYCWS